MALKPLVGATLCLTWLVAREWRTLVLPAPSRPSTSICLLCPLPCKRRGSGLSRAARPCAQLGGAGGREGPGGNSDSHFTVKGEKVPAGLPRHEYSGRGDGKPGTPARPGVPGRNAERAASACPPRRGLGPRRAPGSLRGGSGGAEGPGGTEAGGGGAAPPRGPGATPLALPEPAASPAAPPPPPPPAPVPDRRRRRRQGGPRAAQPGSAGGPRPRPPRPRRPPGPAPRPRARRAAGGCPWPPRTDPLRARRPARTQAQPDAEGAPPAAPSARRSPLGEGSASPRLLLPSAPGKGTRSQLAPTRAPISGEAVTALSGQPGQGSSSAASQRFHLRFSQV